METANFPAGDLNSCHFLLAGGLFVGAEGEGLG